MSKRGQKIREEEGADSASLFEIDLTRLEEEWMHHATIFFDWASRLTDARIELDEQKRLADVIAAEKDRDIRANPADYNLPDKTTENMIKAAISTDVDIQESQKAIQRQKHRVDILQDVVNALDRKKRGLEKEVDLHGQKYFATPRASENSRESVEEFQKQTARRKGMKKRGRDRVQD